MKKKYDKINEKIECRIEEIKKKYNDQYSNLLSKLEKHKSDSSNYIAEIKNQHQIKISELMNQLNEIIKISNEKMNKLNEKYNKEIEIQNIGNEKMQKDNR